MEQEKIRRGLTYGTGSRRYEVIDGELKWAEPTHGMKFEFIHGHKYQVCHLNPAMSIHKGAVGIYKGVRYRDGNYHAILVCLGKKFMVDPAALLPWEGQITEEHLKLISPLKKVHLLQGNRCACKCDSTHQINQPIVFYDEFISIPTNSRCTNCNRISKRLHENGNV